MPSPFPGMDPFVETQEWDDFQHNFITEIQSQLVPPIAPEYVARVDRRVYYDPVQGGEHREPYLLIRRRPSNNIATVVEVLSPANKRPGSDGRELYLKRRQEILASNSHLVELDLLRGGQRMPLLTADLGGQSYYGIVSRRETRPRPAMYQWKLADRMPKIAIPLAEGDGDVPLDLQSAFSNVYQRTHYDLSIDYSAPLVPAPTVKEKEWLQTLRMQGE